MLYWQIQGRHALLRIRDAELPSLRSAPLENQVSICLSTDLPVYYWVHSSAIRPNSPTTATCSLRPKGY